MNGSGTPISGPQQRNVAVDAYRGFVMLLMMGEVLRFAEVARSFPHPLLDVQEQGIHPHLETAGPSSCY
jgi:hypothetical protein